MLGARKARDRMMTWILWGIMGSIVLLLGSILAFLIAKGAGVLSWEFISQPPRDSMTKGGILTPLIGTFQLIGVSMFFSFPIGVATAVYLVEYSRGGAFTKFLRLAIRSLAGVPSVVFGLFGLSFFCIFLGFGSSLLAAGLTLGCLALPVIVGGCGVRLAIGAPGLSSCFLRSRSHTMADHLQGGAPCGVSLHSYRGHSQRGACGGGDRSHHLHRGGLLHTPCGEKPLLRGYGPALSYSCARHGGG